MWSLMQWWRNPSMHSHLEAWVNMWVRSAGLAVVFGGGRRGSVDAAFAPRGCFHCSCMRGNLQSLQSEHMVIKVSCGFGTQP